MRPKTFVKTFLRNFSGISLLRNKQAILTPRVDDTIRRCNPVNFFSKICYLAINALPKPLSSAGRRSSMQILITKYSNNVWVLKFGGFVKSHKGENVILNLVLNLIQY